MCVSTITEPILAKQKENLRKSSFQQITTPVAAKPDITMHRGECSVYGCNCPAYVGADVGTCGNCGHHYDSHRY